MSLNLDSLHVTPLDKKLHNRGAFSCGEPSLEAYLKNQAGQDSKKNAAKVHVLTDPDNPETIIGYFTLSALAVQFQGLPPHLAKRLARYTETPALLIGRLAVSKTHQGKGCGAELLRRALLKCLETSELAGVSLVVVDALHEKAAGFYAKYGFKSFDDSPTYPKRLYLPHYEVLEASQAE